MKDFDLRKYLAENKLVKENIDLDDALDKFENLEAEYSSNPSIDGIQEIGNFIDFLRERHPNGVDYEVDLNAEFAAFDESEYEPSYKTHVDIQNFIDFLSEFGNTTFLEGEKEELEEIDMEDFDLKKYLAENRLTRTIDKLELDTSAEPTRQVVTLRGDSGNFTAKVVDGRVAFETTYPLLDLDLVGFPESNEESVRQFYDRIEQESGMEIPEKSTLIQLANELKAIGADYEFETDPSSNGIALYANIEDVKQVAPEVE